MKRATLIIALLVVAGVRPARADVDRLTGGSCAMSSTTIFMVPGSTNTFVKGINNDGDAFGDYSGSPGGRRGFVRDGLKGTFVTFGVDEIFRNPAGDLFVADLNDDGYAAGNVYYSGGSPQVNKGFIRHPRGDIKVFDLLPNGNVIGLSGGLTVIGRYYDSSAGGPWRSYIRDSSGNVVTFDGIAAGINDKGEIAGTLGGRGFFRTANGSTTFFDVAHAQTNSVTVADINARGDIAGNFWDTSTNSNRNFLRTKQGVLTVFDVPNQKNSYARCLNDVGDVAGYNYLSQYPHAPMGPDPTQGFIRDGKCGTFSIAPELNNVVWSNSLINSCGLNNHGQLAGTWVDPSGEKAHGFIRNPN